MFVLCLVDVGPVGGVDVWSACWGGVEVFFEADSGLGLVGLFGLAVDAFVLEGLVF
jgi:hypothetical protein